LRLKRETRRSFLAEDDADARSAISEMLRMTGYTVVEAVDGAEAVKVFNENRDMINLLLLDVRMPRKEWQGSLRGGQEDTQGY